MSRRIVSLSLALITILAIAYSLVQRMERARQLEQDHLRSIDLKNSILSGDLAKATGLLPRISRFKTYTGEASLRIAAYEGYVDLVRALLDRGFPVDALGGDGQTALHYAARQGKVEVARLLDRGAQVNLRSPGGGAALTQAAQGGHPRMVTLLLARGADARMRNMNGDTAESLARRGKTAGHREALRLLRQN